MERKEGRLVLFMFNLTEELQGFTSGVQLQLKVIKKRANVTRERKY